LIRQRIRTLIDAATARGLRADAVRAFTRIFDYLTLAPRDWGDPVRQYRGLQLTEYRGQHWRLRCRYSVHDRVPIVFLTQIVPIKGSPLFGL
jgi:hypothetical protein